MVNNNYNNDNDGNDKKETDVIQCIYYSSFTYKRKKVCPECNLEF